MKIRFTKEDSLYKIFKTIEKISNGKEIQIFIDSKNSFFENIWWGKQLIDLLNSKEIKFTFLYDDTHAKSYYTNLGVESILVEKNMTVKLLKKFYEFFFIAKNYHGSILKKGNTISYVVILMEIVFVLGLFYFFYSLISPNAKVYIKPSYNVEEIVYNFRYYPENKAQYFAESKYISIPYHTDTIVVTHTLTTSVGNIKYMQKPSRGTVIITNESDRSYSLVANSKLVTDDGILFKTLNWLNIPAAKDGKPSITEVDVEAFDVDGKGNIIGDRGNLDKDVKMYFKNLKDSYYMKKIYANTKNKFKGGSTMVNGSVDQKDIDFLRNKLNDHLRINKLSLLKENCNDKDKILLLYDDSVTTQLSGYDISAKPGDNVPNVQGTIIGKIKYRYVLWSELTKGYETYIKQRISSHMQLIELDRSSLLFYEKSNIDDVFVIPTKIDAIWGYNFGNDVNGVTEGIKSKVMGKDLGEAQDIILKYPEIDVAIIKLSPPWYSMLPRVKSRIKIEIGK